MLNYKLIIQYDGTRYKGWQKQKNTETTIQGKIEGVLTRLLNQEISINGSGRTDAGVHALAQVANFHFDETLANISSTAFLSMLSKLSIHESASLRSNSA